jgi:hypothetical protein
MRQTCCLMSPLSKRPLPCFLLSSWRQHHSSDKAGAKVAACRFCMRDIDLKRSRCWPKIPSREPIFFRLKMQDHDVISTESLNSFRANCSHTFHRVGENEDKIGLCGVFLFDSKEKLLSLMAPLKSEKSLVFCRSSQSCRAVEHRLAEAGLSTCSLHGQIPPEVISFFLLVTKGRGGSRSLPSSSAATKTFS